MLLKFLEWRLPGNFCTSWKGESPAGLAAATILCLAWRAATATLACPVPLPCVSPAAPALSLSSALSLTRHRQRADTDTLLTRAECWC